MTNFTGEQIFWFGWLRDFQTLAIARGKTESDVLMLSFTQGAFRLSPHALRHAVIKVLNWLI